jgi:xylulokinase
LRDSLEIILEMGLPVEEIRASGGGAKSSLWRQIQADVFEREVVTVNAAEGPAYGAALLAGVGTGQWSTVEEACAACIKITSQTKPQEAASTVYQHYYPLYRELYTRLASFYPKLEVV